MALQLTHQSKGCQRRMAVTTPDARTDPLMFDHARLGSLRQLFFTRHAFHIGDGWAVKAKCPVGVPF